MTTTETIEAYLAAYVRMRDLVDRRRPLASLEERQRTARGLAEVRLMWDRYGPPRWAPVER